MATTGIFPLIAQRRSELATQHINALHKAYNELMERARDLAYAVEGMNSPETMGGAANLARELLKDLEL